MEISPRQAGALLLTVAIAHQQGFYYKSARDAVPELFAWALQQEEGYEPQIDGLITSLEIIAKTMEPARDGRRFLDACIKRGRELNHSWTGQAI